MRQHRGGLSQGGGAQRELRRESDGARRARSPPAAQARNAAHAGPQRRRGGTSRLRGGQRMTAGVERLGSAKAAARRCPRGRANSIRRRAPEYPPPLAAAAPVANSSVARSSRCWEGAPGPGRRVSWNAPPRWDRGQLGRQGRRGGGAARFQSARRAARRSGEETGGGERGRRGRDHNQSWRDVACDNHTGPNAAHLRVPRGGARTGAAAAAARRRQPAMVVA